MTLLWILCHLFWGSRFSVQAFPGSPVVQNLPASSGDTELIPTLGRAHRLWSKKSPCTTTGEARVLRIHIQPQEQRLPSAACVPEPESSPSSSSLQLEKGHAQPERPSAVKSRSEQSQCIVVFKKKVLVLCPKV